MKIRSGFVSNSSSSSFVVALKKGHSFDEIIESAGCFSSFAKDVVSFLVREAGGLESIDNIALEKAKRDYYATDDEALEAVKEGEYDWVVKWCARLVDNPKEWFFCIGVASSESDDSVETMLYNGKLNIKSDFLILE